MERMTGKRSYDDGCAAAHALELVGERWALLVVRELMLGPRRFLDLRESLPGLGPSVLSQRLRELAAAGIVAPVTLPPPARVRAYALTDWGRELEPILGALGRWAVRSPVRPRGRPMSVVSLVLSMRTMFDPGRAAGFAARLHLRMARQSFSVTVADGRLTVAPGQPEAPQAAIEGSPDAVAALLYGAATPAAAASGGALATDGDVALVARFATLFPLPLPLPLPAPGGCVPAVPCPRPG